MRTKKVDIVLLKSIIAAVKKNYEELPRLTISDMKFSIPIENSYLKDSKKYDYISFIKSVHKKLIFSERYNKERSNNPNVIKKIIYNDEKKKVVELDFLFRNIPSNNGRLYLYSTDICTKDDHAVSDILKRYNSENPLNYSDDKLRTHFDVEPIDPRLTIKKLILKKNSTQIKNGIMVYHIVSVNNGNIMISDPFSLMTFRQLFRRNKGTDSFYGNQYKKFLKGVENDIKYYIELIFMGNMDNFKRVLNYNLNFYYSDSKLPLSPPLTPKSEEIDNESDNRLFEEFTNTPIETEKNNGLNSYFKDYLSLPLSPSELLEVEFPSMTPLNETKDQFEGSPFENTAFNNELFNELKDGEMDLVNSHINSYGGNLNFNDIVYPWNNYNNIDINSKSNYDYIDNYNINNNYFSGLNDCNTGNIDNQPVFQYPNQDYILGSITSNEENGCNDISKSEIDMKNSPCLTDEELEQFINIYGQDE